MSKFLEILNKTLQTYLKHIVVFDADGLFSLPEIQSETTNQGYQLIFVENALDFRVNYELNRKSESRFAFIARKSFSVLPDVQFETKVFSISFRDFYPFFDGNALAGLNFSALNILSGFKIYETLGFNETVKFILENIYNIDFDTLKSGNSKERILNALITVFLEKESVNKPILDFLSQQTKPFFPELSLIGFEKKSILRLVTSKWEAWINNNSDIDFDEFYLAKTVGSLFIRGLLQPVKVTEAKYNTLVSKIGVYYDANQSIVDELQSIINYLAETLSNIEDKPQEWFDLIHVISRAKLLSLKCNNEDINAQYKRIESRINDRFQLFLEANHSSLRTRSGSKHPFLVTRILEYIRYQTYKKKALIVIDGLSYWQWLIISEIIKQNIPDIESKASFAWIPTITAWSRQSIFKGDIPDLAETNSSEQKNFIAFWKKFGYIEHEIRFYKFGVNKQSDNFEFNNVSILGMVVNDLDDVMHGTLMGDEQLYLSTKQWIDSGLLIKLILSLKQRGFKLFLTSDHGNIEAEGIKSLKLNEKFGALSRSKRHIRFSNETLKNDFIGRNIALPLGIDGLSVYLKDKSAFVPENEKLITHGGSHFWEVIIPFIEI